MPRTTTPPTLIPAHVTLRSLREARGLTAADFAARLLERGVSVGTDHIYDVEVGRKNPGVDLRIAWADELGVGIRDIRTGGELRELVEAADADAAERAARTAA